MADGPSARQAIAKDHSGDPVKAAALAIQRDEHPAWGGDWTLFLAHLELDAEVPPTVRTGYAAHRLRPGYGYRLSRLRGGPVWETAPSAFWQIVSVTDEDALMCTFKGRRQIDRVDHVVFAVDAGIQGAETQYLAQSAVFSESG